MLYNDGFYQQIIARQSFTSDRSPVILLQGAGRQTVGHSHENAGDFRIYYKGLLTGGDGVYDSYASSHHLYYNKATIAHNCLLIYNPAHKSELRGFYSGGQRIRQKTEDIQAFMTDPYYDTGRVLGVAYDTKADGGASYVYFSNDLTAAYDADTVDRIERHMLATFREGDMPLFLFVLDRIDTPQTNFQKTFLLQAVAEPTINGHTAVIDNGQGKLVLINLLGADTIVAHGGEDGADPDRFYISTQNKNLASEGGTAGGGDAYQAGRTNGPMWGKLELSPRLGNTSDFMLNVLYVTDSTYTTLLTPTLLSGDTYLGATVSGQTAVFLKDGEADGHLPLTFTVTGSEMDYYIGGLRTGRWSVAVDGTPIGEMTVRAGEQFLTFRAPSGTVTLTPLDVEAPVAPPPADSGTIVYQTGGGTLPAGAPTEFRYGEVTVLPTELSRGNDIFLGWYADAAHTERIYEIGADVTATRLTVYAAFARSLLVEEYSGETANAMSYDTVSYANCRYQRVKDGENSYLRWVTDSCDPQIRWVGSYADVMDTDTAIAFTLTLGGDGTDPVMAANLYFRDKNRNVLRVFNVTEDGGVLFHT